MKKKITGLTLCALLFALCSSAEAQQPAKIPRIGIVTGTGNSKSPGPRVDAFRLGLRDLGYIEGKNIQVEYRYVEGNLDRAPALVAELVRLKVDVLLVGTLTGIRAAKQATKTIPIVMVTVVDPVATGLIDSLAHPGRNITGLTGVGRELSGKRLELFAEVVPRMSRVGVLWDVNAPGPALALKEYEATAPALKIELQSLEVHGPNPDFRGRTASCGQGTRKWRKRGDQAFVLL
jgi:putative ABC transport system substrate-binding protein